MHCLIMDLGLELNVFGEITIFFFLFNSVEKQRYRCWGTNHTALAEIDTSWKSMPVTEDVT